MSHHSKFRSYAFSECQTNHFLKFYDLTVLLFATIVATTVKFNTFLYMIGNFYLKCSWELFAHCDFNRRPTNSSKIYLLHFWVVSGTTRPLILPGFDRWRYTSELAIAYEYILWKQFTSFVFIGFSLSFMANRGRNISFWKR